MARYAKFFSVGSGGGGTNNLQLPVGTVLDATLRQVQDGTGTGSPLYLSINRVGITSDPTVTTQTSSVIQANTTNANLVISPNGTGALIADIPDGAATGGNARGTNAVDLQTSRSIASEIASGQESVIVGGFGNRALGAHSSILGGFQNSAINGWSVVTGGLYNTASGNYSFLGGGDNNNASGANTTISGGSVNTASSTYATVSGGQSNTASTGTHATVVGGQSNTSSGNGSVSGGIGNNSTGPKSIALGWNNTSSSDVSIALGYQNQASGTYSCVIGAVGTASGQFAVSLGYNSVSAGRSSVCIGGETNRANATNAIVMSGTQGLGYLFSQIVSSPNTFIAQGDCQSSTVNAFKSATLNSAATTVLSLDGTGTTNLIIPNGTNRMWKVKVEYVGTITTITGTATGLIVGDTVYGEENFGFKRLAGTSTMGPIMNETQSSDNAIMDTCALVVTAGASQEMALTFTGPTFAGGGSVTMRIVAKVALVEVAF